MLLKKQGPYECGYCRDTPLESHADKVVLEIVATHLSAYCGWEGILPEPRRTFRRGRSSADMMFVVRRLQKLVREKSLP